MLCKKKKSGVVVVRDVCKKKESPLDVAQLGLVGPKGDKGDKGDPGAPGAGPLTTCPPDSVPVGTTCVDTYEASVWQIALSALVEKVQSGTATMADLTAGGAVILSTAPVVPDSTECGQAPFPFNFPPSGQWTAAFGSSPPSALVYAVSLQGVPPAACVTWFQAQQACAASGKRLLTNEEWQRAAAGTPDPGTDNGTSDCNISSPSAALTGSRASCKSSWGVFDMVGNVQEWVADWIDFANGGCTHWTLGPQGVPGNDVSCIGGPGGLGVPGALIRGGDWEDDTWAGVFAVDGERPPFQSSYAFGFRCAR